MRGGSRPGAGRKKGSPNKSSAELQAEIAASGETPLDYMIRVMRTDDADPRRRDDMAKAVAPYIHPKLTAVELTGKDGKPIETKDLTERPSELELARRIAFVLEQGARASKEKD